MYKDEKYLPGSFWCIYLCIRSLILVEARIDIKQYPRLRKTIKSLTVKHLKQKADIFTAEKVKQLLAEYLDGDKPEELEKKIAIALLYYGLLRYSEVLAINENDVRLDLTENIEVNIPHYSKRSEKGFSFTLPAWIKPSFEKYANQLSKVKNPKYSLLALTLTLSEWLPSINVSASRLYINLLTQPDRVQVQSP